MPGTLYLIPCPIAEEGDVWDVLPAANRAMMASLDYFIVENTRSARRFLSKAKLGRPIEELEFRELNEHTVAGREVEELVAAGIIDPAAAVLPKPLKQRKTYDFPEIQAILADFPAFARAVHAVEHAAGRRLPTADLSALTELFDFHGLSPEALELLTAQCCDEAILRGEERPTARRIEKLGLEWARLGVRSRADAGPGRANPVG